MKELKHKSKCWYAFICVFLVNKCSHQFLNLQVVRSLTFEGPIKKNFINKLVYKCDVKEYIYFSSYIYFAYQIQKIRESSGLLKVLYFKPYSIEFLLVFLNSSGKYQFQRIIKDQDSMNWSNPSLNIRSRFIRKINFNYRKCGKLFVCISQY